MYSLIIFVYLWDYFGILAYFEDLWTCWNMLDMFGCCCYPLRLVSYALILEQRGLKKRKADGDGEISCDFMWFQSNFNHSIKLKWLTRKNGSMQTL